MTDYRVLRKNMVEEQLIPRGIKDEKVLNVFRSVERHEFVPKKIKDFAYEDRPLPIGEGQTISQPYMAALMTESLGLHGHEKVLEIGTGSGYQAAILAGLAKEIYSVERIPLLAKDAVATLSRLGFNNVKVKTGDGTLGWEEYAPYDGIIITAASPKVPNACLEQLKKGGRLVIPLGTMFSQILTVVDKHDRGMTANEICGCVFVPLIGKDGWAR